MTDEIQEARDAANAAIAAAFGRDRFGREMSPAARELARPTKHRRSPAASSASPTTADRGATTSRSP